jgi:hypothetical protein
MPSAAEAEHLTAAAAFFGDSFRASAAVAAAAAAPAAAANAALVQPPTAPTAAAGEIGAGDVDLLRGLALALLLPSYRVLLLPPPLLPPCLWVASLRVL